MLSPYSFVTEAVFLCTVPQPQGMEWNTCIVVRMHKKLGYVSCIPQCIISKFWGIPSQWLPDFEWNNSGILVSNWVIIMGKRRLKSLVGPCRKCCQFMRDCCDFACHYAIYNVFQYFIYFHLFKAGQNWHINKLTWKTLLDMLFRGPSLQLMASALTGSEYKKP